MCFGALWFMVAFGSCYLVGNGQPNGQDDVEQQGAEQHDFKGFDNIVGAHEITKSVVPCTAVIAQNAQVG